MKFRAVVVTSALALASLFVVAQDSSQTTPSQNPSQTTNTTTTPQAPPATQPAPDASQAPAAAQTPAATQPAPDTSVSNTKLKDVKPGSKDDVDSIGNRSSVGKNGGKSLGNWYSLDSEIRMGKEYAQQIEASVKLNQDPVINEYVNRVGQNLVRNSDARVPFTIKVVEDDSINAFALPGGFFYVNTGLILAADEEAELAGVMAHEIAHVAARHAMRQMTRSNWANIGTIPLIFVGGGIGYAARAAAGLGLPLTFLQFSRGFEAEADYLGVEYMYKTGYDPQAYVSFFEKVQAKEKKKPGTLSKAFSTHPQTPDRIEKTQDEISKILPARPQYIVSTSEFDDVKSRLASLENRRKLTDEKDNRPSLRRTTSDTSKDKTTNGDKSGDDRPTLKRRDD